MGKKYYFFLLVLAAAGLVVHYQFWQIPANELQQQDIYYIWLEGKRIFLGENPYSRILEGNLRVNDKYATYFPVVYLFGAFTQVLGFTEFRDWLSFWRPISYLFHMGIVAIVFRSFQQRGVWLLGLVASVILLLGRWSIYIIRVHHIEFATIFFLLLSLLLLQKRIRLALILYSFSLGIKQIGIFLLPLYLIYLVKREDKGSLAKELITGLLWILSIPVLTSIPFLIWNAEGFFKSIMFSATRLGAAHIQGAYSIDVYVAEVIPSLVGIKAKSLMLLLMVTSYFSFLKERVSLLISASVTMMIFLYFNSVLYLQYFIWPLSLTLLAFSESAGSLLIISRLNSYPEES